MGRPLALRVAVGGALALGCLALCLEGALAAVTPAARHSAFAAVESVQGSASPGACTSVRLGGVVVLARRGGAEKDLRIISGTRIAEPSSWDGAVPTVCVGSWVKAWWRGTSAVPVARRLQVTLPAAQGVVSELDGSRSIGACRELGRHGSLVAVLGSSSYRMSAGARLADFDRPRPEGAGARVCVGDLMAALGRETGAHSLRATALLLVHPRLVAQVESVQGSSTPASCGSGTVGTAVLRSTGGESRTVAIGSATAYAGPGAAFDDVCVGDWLVIFGPPASTSTLTPASILIEAPSSGPSPPVSGDGHQPIPDQPIVAPQ